ncbi:hypothetical protein [Kitasatospora aureofaciens]|uniref:hypothetical protein n=1 Tax=Kitasatospora aureofaciens TaxID=1894 RepID=UPI0037C5068E
MTKTCAMLADIAQVVLLMACGTGKTVTAGAIAQQVVSPAPGASWSPCPRSTRPTRRSASGGWTLGAEALGEVITVCSDTWVLDRFNRRAVSAAVSSATPVNLARLLSSGRRITVACTYQSLHIVIGQQWAAET